MLGILKIIRPVNLMLLVIVQSIIRWGVLVPLKIPLALSDLQFCILMLATICIAAGGNIINDVQDVSIDIINNPNKILIGKQVSEKRAYTLYMLLTFLGVCAGFYVANVSGISGLAVVFVGIAALLYVYATHVSSVLLLGNIIISILVAMSLLIVILLDILPAIREQSLENAIEVAKLIAIYAGFAFYINLLREIVKDIQDVDGDKNGGRTTLPIVLGRKRTVILLFILAIFALIAILLITYLYLYNHTQLAFYIVFLVAAPLLFVIIRAWSAENVKDFKLLSILLKIIMFTGILSLLFFAEII